MIETTYGLNKIETSDSPEDLVYDVINGNTDIIITELNKRLESSNLIAGDNITIDVDSETGNVAISTDGTSGREIQLQSNGIHIQWKYTDETTWNNLIALSELKGDIGVDGFSPIATVSKTGGIATITITDKNGTTTATVIDGNGEGGGGGTTDYNYLSNKPAINSVQLSGNKTSSELGLADKIHTHDDKLNASLKGEPNGIAELDENGKVLSSQLPSYVDDVIEGTIATFPTTGETGKIYIDIETNKTYRWSGTVYVVISDTISIGETSSTSYRGDRGKIAYDHSQSTHAPANAQKNSDITKAEIEAKLTGEISTHTHSTTTIDNKIGILSNLATTVKTDLVSAISENREQINVLNVIEELDLLNGWKHTDDTTKISVSRVGNTVTITDFFVTGVKTDPTHIFQLPVGLRPLKAFDVGMECYTSTPWTPNKMFFSFNTDGTVSVRGNPTDIYIRFICTFVCDWEG